MKTTPADTASLLPRTTIDRLRMSPSVGRFFDAEGNLLIKIHGGADGDDPPPADPPPSDPPPADPPEDGKLPDDHPLVKAYRNTKADLAEVRSKRAADREELDRLRREKLPPEEQVIEDAKAEGRREAAMEAAQDLAAARIETALTGLVDDPAVIVEDLNLAKFVTDDGKVDTDKVAALKAKYDGLKPTKKPADLGQGKRPTGEVTPSVSAGRDLFADRKKKK